MDGVERVHLRDVVGDAWRALGFFAVDGLVRVVVGVEELVHFLGVFPHAVFARAFLLVERDDRL